MNESSLYQKLLECYRNGGAFHYHGDRFYVDLMKTIERRDGSTVIKIDLRTPKNEGE